VHFGHWNVINVLMSRSARNQQNSLWVFICGWLNKFPTSDWAGFCCVQMSRLLCRSSSFSRTACDKFSRKSRVCDFCYGTEGPERDGILNWKSVTEHLPACHHETIHGPRDLSSVQLCVLSLQ
jgi:hypothetical protein